MKKLVALVCLAFSLCIIVEANAQAPTLPKVLPPSPNAISLGKYGSQPISFYTGSAQINIPIYEIEGKGIKLPISLSHSGGGLRVSEIASSVGTSWTLNAGGAITRSIMNLPDELPSKGFFNSPPFPTINNYQELSENVNNDYEPDQFFYNFNGNTGKFIFNKSKVLKLIPEKKIIFTPQYGGYSVDDPNGMPPMSGAIVGFSTKTEDGTQYFFEEKEGIAVDERTTIGSSGVQMTSNATDMITRAAVQTWHISKIISPLRDTVYFDYVTRPISFNLPPSVTLNSLLNPFYEFCHSGSSFTNTKQTTYTKQLSKIRFSTGSVEFIYQNNRPDLTGDKSLDVILVKNRSQGIVKKIQFAYKYLSNDQLLDLVSVPSGADPDNLRMFLYSVQEIDPTLVSIKKPYIFDYKHNQALPAKDALAGDYWGYPNGINDAVPAINALNGTATNRQNGFHVLKQVNTSNVDQGTLTKITYPTGGSTIIDYEPNQVLPSGASAPPLYTLNSGYNDIATKNDMINRLETGRFSIDNLDYETSLEMVIEYDAMFHSYAGLSSFGIDVINVATNVIAFSYSAGECQEGITLNGNNRYQCRVFLPITNGTYRIVGRYDGLPNPPVNFELFIRLLPFVEKTVPANGTKIPFGGLRVKQMTDYSLDGVMASKRKFVYESESLTGNWGVYEYKKYLHTHMLVEATITAYDCAFNVLSYNSFYPLMQGQGSYVGYQTVKVFEQNSANVDIGYTEYNYTKGMTASNPFIEIPFCPPSNRDEWMNGVLISEKSYKNVGAGNYSLVRAVNSNYTPISGQIVTAAKTMQNFELPTGTADLLVNRDYRPYFNFKEYSIFSGRAVLNYVETIDYLNNDLSSITSYDYNDQFLPKSITTINSNAVTQLKSLLYPNEMVTSGRDPSGIYQGMINKNMINPLIEESTTKNGKTTLSRTNYVQPYTGVFVPGSVDIRNTVTGLDETRLVYSNYDTKGNPLSLRQEKGLNICYVWSYNSQYPIAEIKNADYTAVVAALGGATAVTNFANGFPANKAAIDTFLAPIRNSNTTFKDAQVTSYSYDPLVGMTSATDPKGMTTTYEYDGFQRLKSIKDHDGNIIKNNDYHYKP